MTDIELSRALRHLRRTVDMLQTELRHGRIDAGLLDDIEARMERGLGTDPRCYGLNGQVDALRESTLTPRPELLGDAIRCCEKLKDAIEGISSRLG